MNMKKSTYIIHIEVVHQGELQKWLLDTGLIGEYEIRYRSIFIQFFKLRLTHGFVTVGNKTALTANSIP